METGTIALSNDETQQNGNKYMMTIILLCVGYFIDFYDLTIFSASYVSVIRESFGIYDMVSIQRLYLFISSVYTIGIFCGAVVFGVFGDKLGRITMIRYSILLYSIAMIVSVFTKSIPVFTFLRFISGVGLAAEFATSSVLIHELLPFKRASLYNSFLYFCGILGGITATYLGIISWQAMYLVGGFSGIILFLLRKKIYESLLFLHLDKKIIKGNFLQLFNSRAKLAKFLRLFILIVPFNFLIVIMFMYPRFMNVHGELAHLTRDLLTGFFIGNLISTICCNFVINKFRDFRAFLLINIIMFVLVMPLYSLINDRYYLLYTIFLGLLGGGLPTVWIQVVVKSYGTNIRSTASNTLFAFGRLSGILFNIFIANWISHSETFQIKVIGAVLIIAILVILSIVLTKNNYDSNVGFIES
ncbi:MAG: MFS transporter [Burkholderiales bacterium]|nr:MFS transporter [Burkholderiales bacterium]